MPGRLRLLCSLFLAVLTVIPTSANAVPDPQVQLKFQFPDGTPMADATVGVVWHPFQAPNAYVSPILAGGLTLTDGSFGFNIETDDALDQFKQDLETKYEDEALPLLEEVPVGGLPDLYELGADQPFINVEVHAVDPDHTWLAVWYLALPLDGTYGETITANMDLSKMPGAAELSSEALAGLEGNVTTCLPNTEPDGFDAMLPLIEDVFDGGLGPVNPMSHTDTNRICAVSAQPADADPTSSAEGYPTVLSPEECVPAPYTCLAATKTRWTKVAEMHSAPGMRHSFLYGEGRDTQTNVAIKSADGGGWGLAGWAFEDSARSQMAYMVQAHNYHRERLMQYMFHKYRTCYYAFVGGYSCWDTWRPEFWTGGFEKQSKDPVVQPPRDWNRSIKIGVGSSWYTETARQWGFGLGVQLGPINLGSQAGFSSITRLFWDGVDGCGQSRILWGAAGKWPFEAPRIYAICAQWN